MQLYRKDKHCKHWSWHLQIICKTEYCELSFFLLAMVNVSLQDVTLVNKRPTSRESGYRKIVNVRNGKSNLLLSNENNRWNLSYLEYVYILIDIWLNCWQNHYIISKYKVQFCWVFTIFMCILKKIQYNEKLCLGLSKELKNLIFLTQDLNIVLG